MSIKLINNQKKFSSDINISTNKRQSSTCLIIDKCTEKKKIVRNCSYTLNFFCMKGLISDVVIHAIQVNHRPTVDWIFQIMSFSKMTHALSNYLAKIMSYVCFKPDLMDICLKHLPKEVIGSRVSLWKGIGSFLLLIESYSISLYVQNKTHAEHWTV